MECGWTTIEVLQLTHLQSLRIGHGSGVEVEGGVADAFVEGSALAEGERKGIGRGGHIDVVGLKTTWKHDEIGVDDVGGGGVIIVAIKLAFFFPVVGIEGDGVDHCARGGCAKGLIVGRAIGVEHKEEEVVGLFEHLKRARIADGTLRRLALGDGEIEGNLHLGEAFGRGVFATAGQEQDGGGSE